MDRTNKINLKKIDALYVSSPSNLLYFTGYSNSDARLIVTPKKSYYISDSRVEEEFTSLFPSFEFVNIKNNSNYYSVAVSLLASLGIKKLGFEEDNLLFKEYVRFIDFKMTAFSKDIANMRSIKEAGEIEKIIVAQGITDNVFSLLLEHIKPGMSELEVESFINSNIYALGGSLAFETIVAFGENTSKPHAHPTKNVLKTKDIVTVDFGAKFDNYCSDMTRSFCFGDPGKEYKEIYQIVLNAQAEAEKFLKIGDAGYIVDSYARNTYPNKYKSFFNHSLGHSLGIDIHESPRFSPKDKSIINKNVVASIEPGLYIPHKFGVRIEDIVVVKEDGAYNLTKSPKELIIF